MSARAEHKESISLLFDSRFRLDPQKDVDVLSGVMDVPDIGKL